MKPVCVTVCRRISTIPLVDLNDCAPADSDANHAVASSSTVAPPEPSSSSARDGSPEAAAAGQVRRVGGDGSRCGARAAGQPRLCCFDAADAKSAKSAKITETNENKESAEKNE